MKRTGICALGSALAMVGATMAGAAEPRVEPFEAPPPVISMGAFGRVVADLGASVHFYRDTLGLEMLEAEIPAPKADATMQKLANTPGAKSRTVHLRVPYTPITLELTEFSGIDRKPYQGDPGHEGVSWLTFSLKDLNSFAALDAAKPPTFSLRPRTGAAGNTPRAGGPPPGAAPRAGGPGSGASAPPPSGAPVANGGLPAGELARVMFIRDPDGQLVEVMKRGAHAYFTTPDPIIQADTAGAPPGGPPVVAMQFVLWQNTEKALRFYREILGFEIKRGYTRSLQDLEPNLNLPAATTPGPGNQASITGNCAWVRCEWFETTPPGPAYQPRIQDPGASYLNIWVHDIDGLLTKMKAVGIETVTPGGRPIRSGDTRMIMVRDFSRGVYVTLMEQASSRH